MKIYKIIILAFITLCTSLLIGVQPQTVLSNNVNKVTVVYNENENLKEIKDLKAYLHEQEIIRQQEEEAKAKAEKETKLDQLKQEITAVLGDKMNNVGIAYYDIDTGLDLTINGDKIFTAASTVKVPLNMVVSDMIADGQINKDEELKYDKSEYEGGTGILQGQDLSKPIPVQTLSEYSIRYSDNIATNMLLHRMGYEKYREAVDAKIGHASDHSQNVLSANDAKTVLKQLYDQSTDNPYYAQIIEWMKNTAFHDRLDRDIDHSIVAHKIGNYGAYVNDIGIIYTEHPYILAVYTNAINDAPNVIAQISDMFYGLQTAQK